MTTSPRWLLPEGIDEILPDQARVLEDLSRRLLDYFDHCGYDFVIPPLVDYLESLLVGSGHDLDLQTFKFTDQLSGRTLGIRADMTPQVARIDAHHLHAMAPTRLCYLGTVLHTRTDGFAGSRSLLQVGAELYGHAGVDSDMEILQLMAGTLDLASISPVYLDLGHVGIYRAIVASAGLDEDRETALFDALQRKAIPEIREMLDHWMLPEADTARLLALAELHGGPEVLDAARTALAGAAPDVFDAIDTLETVADRITAQLPNINLHFDLAELRGYHYHTGLVFAAYAPGRGQAIALGGRYDGIGQAFGQARPATGFSTDLRTLAAIGKVPSSRPGAIFAPADPDPALQTAIADLRAQGERIIVELPGQAGGPADMGCDRRLVARRGQWEVVPL